MDNLEETPSENIPEEQLEAGQEEAPAIEETENDPQEDSSAPLSEEPEAETAPEAPSEEVAAAAVAAPESELAVANDDGPSRSGAQWALIAFIVVLVFGVIIVAALQFSRGLSLPSGISSLFVQSQTTESGVQYEDTRQGSGDPVKAGDAISVHYTGWLEDGTEFDSSIPRGEAFSFVVGYGFVIPGWDEGVVGMQEGGVRRLTIPSELGYGEDGAGDLIPPNSTLIFEVELVDVHTTDIEEVVVGEGTEAVPGSNVTLEYTVWLMDGTEIDSSATAGQPIVFVLGTGQMLPGIEQGVTGMQVGGKRLVTIPPEMAFGEQGLGDLVPPGATLQFEFELVAVE